MAMSSESIYNDEYEPVEVWWQLLGGGPPAGGYDYNILYPRDETPPKPFSSKLGHEVCVRQIRELRGAREESSSDEESIERAETVCKVYDDSSLTNDVIIKVSEVINPSFDSTSRLEKAVSSLRGKGIDITPFIPNSPPASPRQNKPLVVSNDSSSPVSSLHGNPLELDGSISSHHGSGIHDLFSAFNPRLTSSSNSSLATLEPHSNRFGYYMPGLLALFMLMLALMCLKKVCSFQRSSRSLRGLREPLMDA